MSPSSRKLEEGTSLNIPAFKSEELAETRRGLTWAELSKLCSGQLQLSSTLLRDEKNHSGQILTTLINWVKLKLSKLQFEGNNV